MSSKQQVHNFLNKLSNIKQRKLKQITIFRELTQILNGDEFI